MTVSFNDCTIEASHRSRSLRLLHSRTRKALILTIPPVVNYLHSPFAREHQLVCECS
jgi:hypothetical protein